MTAERRNNVIVSPLAWEEVLIARAERTRRASDRAVASRSSREDSWDGDKHPYRDPRCPRNCDGGGLGR